MDIITLFCEIGDFFLVYEISSTTYIRSKRLLTTIIEYDIIYVQS